MRPYYTYRRVDPTTFLIEDPNDDLLIGDQLPSTEDEARLLCRVANLARDQAVAEYQEKALKSLSKVFANAPYLSTQS